MNRYVLLGLRIAAFAFCSVVALTSEIAITSAIWGFSSGVWFVLSLKSWFEDFVYVEE